MNFNRFAGIFITSTILIWILIFALSPQPKYQTTNKVIIPSLPIASELTENFSNMEPSEIENSNFTLDIQDNIVSAKSIIEKVDFNLYVYKIGAFGSTQTVSKVIQLFSDEGFPAFAKMNPSNPDLTNVLVGPFVSEDDINKNQEILNKIAGITNGETLTWNP